MEEYLTTREVDEHHRQLLHNLPFTPPPGSTVRSYGGASFLQPCHRTVWKHRYPQTDKLIHNRYLKMLHQVCIQNAQSANSNSISSCSIPHTSNDMDFASNWTRTRCCSIEASASPKREIPPMINLELMSCFTRCWAQNQTCTSYHSSRMHFLPTIQGNV